MHTDLNGEWTLWYGPQSPGQDLSLQLLPRLGWKSIPAQVPGNVELDLLRAGLLGDLVQGNGIYQLRRLEAYAWCYQREFLAPTWEDGHRIFLCFGGIDCIAAIYVNGELAGRSRNMLIEQRFDVTSLLRPEAPNQVAVLISSAVLEARQHQFSPLEFAAEGRWDSLALRKAAHSFGWDIMPRAVSAGLWRDVSLQIQQPTRIRTLYWTTLAANPAAASARVLLDWDIATDRALVDDLQLRVTLQRAGVTLYATQRPLFETHGRLIAQLDHVELWWPRGLGEAALYEACVQILDQHGRVLDEQCSRVGIRTVELRRSAVTMPQQPGEFVFVVNGEKVFIKGTNWVPLDAFHSRDPQHLQQTFDMAVDLNCNMLRCWGGNVYEDHPFFDLCDQHGILVWQDFSLGCAVYPQDDAFAAQVRQEAESVVTRLRNHPSLALWAGNNENDDAHVWAQTGLDPNQADRISRVILAQVVRCLDPLRPYLPSSPYRSPELMALGGGDQWKPEDHLWGPRNDFKGDYYILSPAHFVSEIGYHGCPARQTIQAMMDPQHLWPPADNDQWLTHCVRPHPRHELYNYRIELMTRQIAVLFDQAPDNLDDYIFASQASQAEALKFFIERWRIAKWRRTGILWWNLRDGWPIISDAIVDYYHRPKLAYHVIKRSQADLCVICDEPVGGCHALIAVNDTRRHADFAITLTDPDGRQLLHANCRVPAGDKAIVGTLPQSSRQTMWRIDYHAEGKTLQNYYLAGPRPFSLPNYRKWIASLRPAD